MKITKKDNISIEKNRKNTMSAKNQKYCKINTEKRIKSRSKRGKVLKLTLSETNRNITQPEITNIYCFDYRGSTWGHYESEWSTPVGKTGLRNC